MSNPSVVLWSQGNFFHFSPTGFGDPTAAVVLCFREQLRVQRICQPFLLHIQQVFYALDNGRRRRTHSASLKVATLLKGRDLFPDSEHPIRGSFFLSLPLVVLSPAPVSRSWYSGKRDVVKNGVAANPRNPRRFMMPLLKLLTIGLAGTLTASLSTGNLPLTVSPCRVHTKVTFLNGLTRGTLSSQHPAGLKVGPTSNALCSCLGNTVLPGLRVRKFYLLG